jgi:tetratricopeptide (TPR) repeat protein
MEAPNAAADGCKYAAFISYSSRDERCARWLHKAIERYRVPEPLVGQQGRHGPIPEKIFPVFRDRDELASSADLSKELRYALAQSAYLIVLCSLAAVRSRWVNQEIAEFKQLGRGDRILALIVHRWQWRYQILGRLWRPAAKPARDYFPPAFRFQMDAEGRLIDQPAEPLAADLRPGTDGKYKAKLKLLAPVLGVSFEELRDREKVAARQRALVRQMIGAAVGAALLLLTVYAWISDRFAENAVEAGIKIAADSVGDAVEIADQEKIPRKAIGYMLARAQSGFRDLYGLYEKTGEPPASLRGQYALLLLVFADHYGVMGETERQRATAEEASDKLKEVIDEEPATAEWRRQRAMAEDLVADAHAMKWQVEEALSGYRSALAIRQRLAADDPENTRLQRGIGLSNTNIGDMLRRQGKWGPALNAYCAALKIEVHLAGAPFVPQLVPYCGEVKREEHLAVPPSDPQLERDLMIGNQRVGDMLLKRNAYEAAEAAYSAAVAIAKRLADVDRENVQVRRDLAVSRSMLGNALWIQGKSEAAIVEYKASLKTAQELAEGDPDNVGLQRDWYKSHEAIGILRFEQHELDEARVAFSKALTIAEPLVKNSANSLLKREVSVLHNRLGEVFEARGQLDHAVAEYGKVLDVRRELAEADPRMHRHSGICR